MALPPPTSDELQRAEALVRKHLGFPSLRAGQAETLARVLRGDDVLAILPTGGGKSLCYQLPAVLGKRVTLVVSPLVALMKDQLDSLPPAMRAAATSLTGDLTLAELRGRMSEVASGRYRLVYVAPERLRSVPLLRALREAGVERLVVDEAHCVSTWGHDFRPDYLALADVRKALGDPQVVAMTATAPPRVTQDIQKRLGPLEVVRASVFRPNLRLEAVLAKDADEKLAHLVELCRRTRPPGIVYANSRVKTEQLAAALQSRGVNARAYHAGLPDRSEIQDLFMANEVDVIVATVAFGMGVDKPDIHFVFHADPSASLENYVQEAGRAGRDGEPARCVLLATGADGGTLKNRAKGDLPSLDLVGRVWSLIVSGLGEDGYAIVEPEQLDALDQDDVKCRVALSVLQEAGAIERYPDAPRFLVWRQRARDKPAGAHAPPAQAPVEMTLFDAAVKLGVPPPEVERTLITAGEPYRPLTRAILVKVSGRPEGAEDVLEAYAKRATARVDEILGYVRSRECRHATIRRHFGERAEDVPARCENCDVCLGITHEAGEGDDEEDARAILAALGSIRGIGEQNLILMLRGDPLAPPWTDGKPGAGALGFRSASKVKALIRTLEARGHIARETLANGGQALRLAARDVPEGPLLPRATGSGPTTGLPARAPGSPGTGSGSGTGTPAEAGDPALFDALKAWRRGRAEAEGVPAYVVAHDSVLREIAATRPTSREALGEVKGMGPKKIEKYGDEILRLVQRAASADAPSGD